MSDERPKVLAGVDPEALRQLVERFRRRYGTPVVGELYDALEVQRFVDQLAALLPPASSEQEK